MEEAKIDPAAMGLLAKALVFICGPDHPTAAALEEAAESGFDHESLKLGRTYYHSVWVPVVAVNAGLV